MRRGAYEQHRLIMDSGSSSGWPFLKLLFDVSVIQCVACLSYFYFSSSLEKNSSNKSFSKIISCNSSTPVLFLSQIDEELFNILPCWVAEESFCGVYYHFALISNGDGNAKIRTQHQFYDVSFCWFLCCQFYCLIVLSLKIILGFGAGLSIFFYK